MSVGVVTGGASGIGLGFARALGGRGLKVVVADVNAEALGEAVAGLQASGVDAVAHPVDLRDHEAVATLADRARSLGSIETACLNAGVSYSGSTTWETPRGAFDFVFGINFYALVDSIAVFAPVLIEQGTPAKLVITASMAGMIGIPTSSAYAASKAAAVSVAKSVRGELAERAPFVTVTCLNPGMVATNLQRTSAALQPQGAGMGEQFVEESHAALNSLGASPDEVAGWALDAADHGRFWVFPPSDDPFRGMLVTELGEMNQALSGS
jgi:NAD(P)-dependent dehydrogenase (short-subunit alcohol dehydrogenase family)